MRAHNRAVTAGDFEYLAKETSLRRLEGHAASRLVLRAPEKEPRLDLWKF